ncbi:LIM domain only protein 3-like [Hydractinia symbiolongicarpus]|uniref:LIM domain only protein 3-like n=1 Tax=Hydractinia symbiolongicarpus TaxID=13093 RepID=UPI0025505599|nr:LIM domain only protein 3-like [Hydractinia symbiolongicarpus]
MARKIWKCDQDVRKRVPGARKQSSNKCAGCQKRIRSRFLVQALDKIWHERCLTCDVCNEILYSFGENKLYYRQEIKLCKLDYMRLFVPGGQCSICENPIPSTEKVIKYKNNINYHVSCFNCGICKYKFAAGDIAHIPKPNIILCTDHQVEDVQKLESVLKEKQTSKIRPITTTSDLTTQHTTTAVGKNVDMMQISVHKERH